MSEEKGKRYEIGGGDDGLGVDDGLGADDGLDSDDDQDDSARDKDESTRTTPATASTISETETEIEPSIAAPRVALGTKDGREQVTTYIDMVRKDDIADLVNSLKNEYEPSPNKMDVTAAIFYAGMEEHSDDLHDHLEEFGYTRV